MATGPWQAQALTAGGVFHAADVANLTRQVNYLSGLPLSGDDEKPQADLQQSVAQSIPSGTATALLFDIESLDTANGHSTTTNTSRYTCQTGKGGWYNVTGVVGFAANGTGARQATIRTNAATIWAQVTVNAVTGGGGTGIYIGKKLFLAAGDYVEIFAYQSSGAAVSTSLGPPSTMDIEQCRMQ
jgi:hypothetical protein